MLRAPRDPLVLPDAVHAGDLPQAALVLSLYKSSPTAATRFVRDWGLAGVAAGEQGGESGGPPPAAAAAAAAADSGAVRRFLTAPDASRLAACVMQQRQVQVAPEGTSAAQQRARLAASLTPELRTAAQLVAALRWELGARQPPPPSWLLPPGSVGGADAAGREAAAAPAPAAQQLLASIAHAVLVLAGSQGTHGHRPASLLVAGLVDALVSCSPGEARALLYGEVAAAEVASAAWGAWRWGGRA